MKRFRIIFLLVPALCGMLAALILGIPLLRSGHRHAWKERAIAEIARRTADPRWATNEAELLRKQSAVVPWGEGAGWVSDHLLQMSNGEWIAYANVCSKENWLIDDLFIGKGSDGRWYYSTYHFCIGMVSLSGDDQSESLTNFAHYYFLVPFDGHSDVCLRKTWPPATGPWLRRYTSSGETFVLRP
jgi:hypothetical protein